MGAQLRILNSLGNRTKIGKYGGTLEGPEGKKARHYKFP